MNYSICIRSKILKLRAPPRARSGFAAAPRRRCLATLAALPVPGAAAPADTFRFKEELRELLILYLFFPYTT